jgi:hypothetical protein
MADHLQGIRDEVSRQRRTHRKSRLGCRNCKIRRIKVSHVGMLLLQGRITNFLLKCDETRPQCKKCMSFRVSCNYDPKAADLQLSVGEIASIKSPQISPNSTNQSLHGMIESPTCLVPAVISDNNSTFQLDGPSLDRLGRFQMRTALSLGTARGSRVYPNEIIKFAFSVRAHIKRNDTQANISFCA